MENLRLTRVLADAGHQVDVITYPFGSAPEYPGVTVHRCAPVPLVRGVRIGFSAAKLMLDVNLAAHVRRFARANGCDCIHGVEEGAFIGILAGRKLGIPVVYDMDSVMSYEIGSGAMGRLPGVTRLMRGAECWAVRNSALIITISTKMADYVKQINPSANVVIVPDIPTPMPPGGPRPDRARHQMPAEFANGRKLIVYAGSFARYQGLDSVIAAMPGVVAQLPGAALVLVGGDDADIKRLTKLAEVTGVIQNVLFVGKKPPQEVPHFLSAADVLVSPRRGGMNPPAKMYTYMQSGVPIVATDIPAHTALLDSNCAVLVQPTVDSIACGILWALAHPDDAKRRGARARESVSGMTPDMQTRPILDAYERLGAKIG